MTRPLTAEHVTTGSAPARLCLGGEDLDWIGGPALLSAIDLPISVTFHRQPTTPTLTIQSQGALPARLTLPRSVWHEPTDSVLELTRLCWHYAHDRSGRATVGGHISITSDVPPNAGLASSATACVAALRALMPTAETGAVAAAQLARAADHVERELAGRPVGPMDFVPAAFGGTTLVHTESERIANLTHLSLPREARFLVVDTRTPRDTGAVIAWKRGRLARREASILHYAEHMPALVAEQARLLAVRAPLDTFGQTLDQAQVLLRDSLRVATPLVDECATRLRANGALGVKLTGTGLGGCLLALTTTSSSPRAWLTFPLPSVWFGRRPRS